MNKYNFQFLGWRLILNSTFLILNSKVNPPVNFVDILPYKGRQTPLTPLHRGGLGLLAFSLIELSIVLIIIGLLVAGVTGGKSLIESAKQRAFINELNNWKQAVYTFYASQGRLPGDIKKIGKIGSMYNSSGYLNSDYSSGTFGEPYTAAQSIYNAPFIEMYLEGVSDFKPKSGGAGLTGFNLSKNGYTPMSKLNLGYYFSTINNFSHNINYSIEKTNGIYLHSYLGEKNNKYTLKSLKYADEKLDDGVQNTGSVRAHCKGINSNGTVSYGYANYDESLNGGECSEFFYKVFDI